MKSVPAEDGLVTLTVPLSLIFTNPAALTLKLYTPVVRLVPAEPILPAVDVRLSVGVVMVPKLELVIFPLEVKETCVLPLSVLARLKEPLVAVRLIDGAVMFAVLLRLCADIKLK